MEGPRKILVALLFSTATQQREREQAERAVPTASGMRMGYVDVAEQLQSFLVDTLALDPFQSDFCPGHRMEMALVAFTDDLCTQLD